MNTLFHFAQMCKSVNELDRLAAIMDFVVGQVKLILFPRFQTIKQRFDGSCLVTRLYRSLRMNKNI